MIFSGLKKLSKIYGFKNNGTFIYGMVKNTYIVIFDGNKHKNVWFRFPGQLDEGDKIKIESWKRKGYAKEIIFLEDNAISVEMNFIKYIVPFNIKKIKEVIDDITNYIFNKYPEGKILCSEDNCSADAVTIYNIGGFPLPLCRICAEKQRNRTKALYEKEKAENNNYIKGVIYALFFCIPGILFNIFFAMLGKIAGICGAAYYGLAREGFLEAKGKFNKIGIALVSFVSLLFSVFGAYVGFFAYIVKKIIIQSEIKSSAFKKAVEIAFKIMRMPEVKKEITANIHISLVFCGIAIILFTIKDFQVVKKIKIRKI